MALKLLFFFFEKLQELPRAGGLASKPYNDILFSYTQFSQPKAFKTVITGFLNQQTCQET